MTTTVDPFSLEAQAEMYRHADELRRNAREKMAEKRKLLRELCDQHADE